ncbi:MAG: STAS domain-containing protein [bacterium]|nr:STAS domain-containing protein [bacterium]
MFQVEKHGDVAVLTATQKLEGSTRLWARRQFDDLLECGINRLVLDFSLVEFLDSSGLGSVVVTFHRTRKAGGNLCVCGLNQSIRSVFELTLLDEVIPICDTWQEGIEAVKKQPV